MLPSHAPSQELDAARILNEAHFWETQDSSDARVRKAEDKVLGTLPPTLFSLSLLLHIWLSWPFLAPLLFLSLAFPLINVLLIEFSC